MAVVQEAGGKRRAEDSLVHRALLVLCRLQGDVSDFMSGLEGQLSPSACAAGAASRAPRSTAADLGQQLGLVSAAPGSERGRGQSSSSSSTDLAFKACMMASSLEAFVNEQLLELMLIAQVPYGGPGATASQAQAAGRGPSSLWEVEPEEGSAESDLMRLSAATSAAAARYRQKAAEAAGRATVAREGAWSRVRHATRSPLHGPRDPVSPPRMVW